MTNHKDARQDLERMPSESLYNIACNESAAHRVLAFRLLIERGGPLAMQPEIADEARELALNDAIVLKRIDPASAVLSLKMPGVIDCLADNQVKRAELAELVDERHATGTRKLAALEATVNHNHAAAAQALADETGALGQAVSEWHRQLKETSNARSRHLDRPSSRTRPTVSKLYTRRTPRSGSTSPNNSGGSVRTMTVALTLDEKSEALQAEHTKNMQAANDRIALLERSPWRKLARLSQLRTFFGFFAMSFIVKPCVFIVGL
jgi:hypothetical protein